MAREVEAHKGALILEHGEGDSVFAVFTRESDAVAAAFEFSAHFKGNHGQVMYRFESAWRFILAKRPPIIEART